MRYVFVTGMGRSGTTFLAHLLRGVPGADAHHEHIGEKGFTMLSRYLDEGAYAVPFLKRCKTDVERRRESSSVFVDVNSRLRYSVPALKKVFDGCAIYHQVRDPRAVVPSVYLRQNGSLIHSLPYKAEDIEWMMDVGKFEKICWAWTDATRRLLGQETELLQFERLTSDYEYLRKKLLTPVGLDLSRDDWEAKKNVRVNKTRSSLFRYVYAKMKGKNYVEDALPPYAEWPNSRKEVFERICGETRRRVGYE